MYIFCTVHFAKPTTYIISFLTKLDYEKVDFLFSKKKTFAMYVCKKNKTATADTINFHYININFNGMTFLQQLLVYDLCIIHGCFFPKLTFDTQFYVSRHTSYCKFYTHTKTQTRVSLIQISLFLSFRRWSKSFHTN